MKILLSSLICLGLFSCLKEELVQKPVTSGNTEVSSRDNTSNNVPYVASGPVILGEEIANPYTVDIVNQANAILYGEGYDPVEATHQYIKFTPQNYDEVAVLQEWSFNQNFVVFDFPLHYEFVQKGDFYIDPAVTDTLLNYQYASVPIDVDLPAVSHTVLEEFFLDESNPFTFIQTYQMTGHGDKISKIIGDGIPEETAITHMPMHIPCEVVPQAPTCEDHCELVLMIEWLNEADVVCWWECHCSNEGGGNPPTNDCGCPLPPNPNIPAGCVRVTETNAGPAGVRIAKIRVWDWTFIFLKSNITFTDDAGCWSLDREYDEFNMQVIFENGNLKVRDLDFWFGHRILRDETRSFTVPPYNAANILFERIPDELREWAASHTLNADRLYRLAAQVDNIPQPRIRLNYTLGERGDFASAPMLQNNIGASTAILSTLGGQIQALAAFFLLPDITNGYNEFTNSNVFKSDASHELGHASHYSLVGEVFWTLYRQHIVVNNLPGTNTPNWGQFGNFQPSSSPELVALGEAIGTFMEVNYGYAAGVMQPLVIVAEAALFGGGDFVPVGLVWDLTDNTPGEPITDPLGIADVDNVTGYTAEMVYDALQDLGTIQSGPSGLGVSSIRDFRNRLADLHLANTPNNLVEHNNLFDVYDVFN